MNSQVRPVRRSRPPRWYAAGNRMLGRVVACNGSRATIAAVAEEGGTDLTGTLVGRPPHLDQCRQKSRRGACLFHADEGKDWGEGADNQFLIEVELLGEVYVQEDGKEIFSTGISRYPYLGAIAHGSGRRPAAHLRYAPQRYRRDRQAHPGRDDRRSDPYSFDAVETLCRGRLDGRRQIHRRFSFSCARRSRATRSCAS